VWNGTSKKALTKSHWEGASQIPKGHKKRGAVSCSVPRAKTIGSLGFYIEGKKGKDQVMGKLLFFQKAVKLWQNSKVSS